MDELILPESDIQVVRVEKVTDVVEEQQIAVETKKDDSLLKGKEKVVQAGKKGTVSRTYEVVKENGKEVSRNHYRVRKVRLKNQQTKVVASWNKSSDSKCFTWNKVDSCIRSVHQRAEKSFM